MSPFPRPLPHHELLGRIQAIIPADKGLHLVGGALRDAFLQRQSYDLDFTLPREAREVSKRLANQLKAHIFPLDEGRNTWRLILESGSASPLTLDIAAYRGADLETDLRLRDFTINALAIDLHKPDVLIDPLNGLEDLRQKRLRACYQKAFQDDPVRVLRAARLALNFGLRIEKGTLHGLREAAALLRDVSPERSRDEMFKIFAGTAPHSALRLLEQFNALEAVFPEVAELRGLKQPPPHTLDAWEHSLATLERLKQVLTALAVEHDEEKTANWGMGLLSLRLGRYRQQLADYLNQPLNVHHTRASLLMMAALYHDTGKAITMKEDENGRMRFIGHEKKSALYLRKRGEHLRLSNKEVNFMVATVAHHMRLINLANNISSPSPRAIYRFFKDTGEAGIAVILLSLADTLATYGVTLGRERWIRQLDVARAFMDGWWEKQSEIVSPPPLLSGDELMSELGLSPGPIVGKLLAYIQEAQAAGEIHTPAEAVNLSKTWLKNHFPNQG